MAQSHAGQQLAQLIFGADVDDAWRSVRTANDGDNILVVGFDFDGTTVEVIAAGPDGFECLRDTVSPSEVAFAVLRVVCHNAGESRDRFVFVSWNAPDIPRVERERVPFQADAVRRHFSSDISMEFNVEINNMEELTQLRVATSLNESLGTGRPERYEFGPLDYVDVTGDKLVHLQDGQAEAAQSLGKREKSDSPAAAETASAQSTSKSSAQSTTQSSAQSTSQSSAQATSRSSMKRLRKRPQSRPVTNVKDNASTTLKEVRKNEDSRKHIQPSLKGDAAVAKGADSVRDEGRMNAAEGIDEAWAKVRDEVDGFNFMVIGITAGTRDTVELVGSGTGGFKSMVELFDATRILFSVLRVPGVDVVGHRNRYVFITYIGASVPGAQKARVVFQKSATKKLLTGIPQFLDYEISDNASFSQVSIAEAVDRALGAGDRPDRYVLGPHDYVDVHGDKLVQSSSDTVVSASARDTLRRRRMPRRARNKLDVSVDAECLSTWEALLEGKVNYFVMGYGEDSDENIVLTDKGSGGFKALRANFAADLVQFAFLSVPAIDLKRAFPKVLFIVWTGADVGMMRKARLTPQIEKIKGSFSGHVIYMLQVSELSQLTQVSIAEFLLDMGDKPDKYQLGPGDFVRIVEGKLIHEETGDENDSSVVAAAPASAPKEKPTDARKPLQLKACTEASSISLPQQKALKAERLKLKSEKTELESRLRKVQSRLEEIQRELDA